MPDIQAYGTGMVHDLVTVNIIPDGTDQLGRYAEVDKILGNIVSDAPQADLDPAGIRILGDQFPVRKAADVDIGTTQNTDIIVLLEDVTFAQN